MLLPLSFTRQERRERDGGEQSDTMEGDLVVLVHTARKPVTHTRCRRPKTATRERAGGERDRYVWRGRHRRRRQSVCVLALERENEENGFEFTWRREPAHNGSGQESDMIAPG